MVAYGIRAGSAMGTRIQRMMQLAQVRFVLNRLDTLLDIAQRNQRQYVLLESVSRGLYEELDKLCALGPAVPISLRAFDEVDCFLEEAERLMTAPPYQDPFVVHFVHTFGRGPAPAHYDAVLALRQARQALDRYKVWLMDRLDKIESRRSQAEAIRCALEVAAPFINGAVLRRDVEQIGVKAHPDWFRNFSYNLSDFDFDRLNNTNILPYFLADLS